MRHSIAKGRPSALALAIGLAWLAAAPPAAAFGGAGYLGECDSFTTCTATAASGGAAFSRYTFSNIFGGYLLPSGMNPGHNDRLDQHATESTALSESVVGAFCVPCASDNPFLSSATARAQSNFGVNRASAASSFGAAGTDDRGGGSSADVRVTTGAQSSSVWRDVWSFSGDGHLSGRVTLDGQASNAASNVLFPSTFMHTGVGTYGDWFYDLTVWDVDHLSISEYFEDLPGPTLVASLRDRSGSFDEQRPSFGSELALDFDYEAGVRYVVIAELGVQASNGRTIDLFHTARLSPLTLSDGTSLSALSGHDYLAPVPEPQSLALLLLGLGLIVPLCRRQRH